MDQIISTTELNGPEMSARVVELEGRACVAPALHAEVRRISTAKIKGRRIRPAKLNGPKN